ncbi:putative selenate ABC transporter substrate-binding protein [Roseateles chitinivorans]|uniref:putative selenate ABC transporter substrate-binding protein n=1 Tax=Roseateles chitinivorans TaxID=2917965 RepID=UPI003D67743B
MPGTLRHIGQAMRGAVAAALMAAGAAGLAPAQTPGGLRVTAVPDESPAELALKFAPLGRYLERELDLRVEWTPSPDYAAAVDAIASGKVDLAWLGGFTFVQANVRSGGRIVPLVQREDDGKFRSVFIAAARSGITKLEDLRGRSLSFGSALSTSGHLMPRSSLMAAKINPDTDLKRLLFSGAHDATVAAVVSGKVDAGALNASIWHKLVAEKKVDPSVVTVFFTTPAYHDTNWSVRDDMPAATREAIKAAFLRLDASTPEGRQILELQRATKYVPTRVENYNGIKAAAENAGLLK